MRFMKWLRGFNSLRPSRVFSDRALRKGLSEQSLETQREIYERNVEATAGIMKKQSDALEALNRLTHKKK